MSQTFFEDTPEIGITDCCQLRSQGPSCALASAPATAARYYLVENKGRKGQTSSRQLNLLEDFEEAIDNDKRKFFSIKNGFVEFAKVLSIQSLNSFLNEKKGNRDHFLSKIRIGFHEGVEVVYSNRSLHRHPQKDHLVSLALCSAVYCDESVDGWHPFAQLVLDAMYEATLWAAVINASKTGCKKVFLTFLGGGAFGNDMKWITAAMHRACWHEDLRSADLEVVVVHFREINARVVKQLGTEKSEEY